MKTRITKRAEAAERNAKYSVLTTTEKYVRALERGHGETREAARLRAQLEAENV